MIVFFATDVHGSDVCWKKFINAGKYYRSEVLILGGDMTGKAIIPFIKQKDGFHFDFMENKQILQSEEEVRQAEKMIADKGYYPVRFTPEEIDYYREHPEEREALFTQKALKRLEDWLAFAESKLKDTGIKVFVCPGNDDMFEIDDLLEQSPYITSAEGQAFDLAENCQLISTGWCNPTPWNTFREEPDDQLLARLEKMLPLVRDFKRLICNFHGPPYGSGLDDAAELDENLRPKFAGQSLVPVGSKAVRDFIYSHQPMLGLFGHIHEARGMQRLKKTMGINPGSAYEQGLLQGALIEINKKGVRNYLLTSG
ncbi:MAG: metallophosphoesterase [Desulfotomaculaceae bacterium]|nr:metallophosphoesterase [Desulfotomaculaceae bacterium]MDD4767073.1 metallophosphoesterase [Desulfotomaculaceae bacterium]